MHHEPGQRGSGVARTPRGKRSTWLAFALCVIVAVVCADLLMTPAHAQAQGPKTFFDIPAQSLDAALNAYATAVGRDVYYDGALVLGRRSAMVKGMLTPDDALRALLRGTGFAARNTGVRSFTISGPPDETKAVFGSTGRADYQRYFAAVQAGIRQAFCDNPEVGTEDGQRLVKLWLTPSGIVSRAVLLEATTQVERDEAFIRVLETVRVSLAAPPGMPSSITMMVFPRVPDAPAECGLPPDIGGIRRGNGAMREIRHGG